MDLDTVIVECLIVGAAWSLGDGYRIRRRQVIRLEDRATKLEHEREALAEKAVAEERRVIARELHDVVAHNVSVIVAQSGAAQRVYRSHPDEAFATLGAIERAGRAALVEMRRLMGFLRMDEDDSPTHSPQPGSATSPPWWSRYEGPDCRSRSPSRGLPRTPPAGLDLSAYRIVQEALTNAIKHAGPASAWVTVRYERTTVLLTVEDDGSGTPERGTETRLRYGHLGMQERVALFGGWLRTGPIP